MRRLLPTTAEVTEEIMRTAFALQWALCEEMDGRPVVQTNLAEAAPFDRIPLRFFEWATEALSAAILIAYREDPGILKEWANISPEDLGCALAVTIGGWTDGLAERGIRAPEARLPLMGEDARLYLEPEDYQENDKKD